MGEMGNYAKSLLVLAGAGLLAGAGYIFLVSDKGLALRAAVGASGGSSCAWEGEDYPEGAVRAATDGCNTCVCAETGWSCSQLLCRQDGEKLGIISGTLRYPGGGKPVLRVCAVDLKDEKKQCLQAVPGAPSFALRVPPGRYWVYAENDELKDSPLDRYKAWYSEYLVCGQGPECKDRSPVAVTVEMNGIAEAHPNDWSAPSWVHHFSITPTNRKYGSTYHYNDGVFNVRTKGMSEVEVWYLHAKMTAAEPDDTEPKLIGRAELVETDDRGFQAWRLAVPAGFRSSHVWAVARDAEGNFMRSWDIGWVKPDATVSAP